MLKRPSHPARRVLAAMALVISPGFGQLPTARLDAIFPPGLKSGTEAVMALSGSDLEEVNRLVFNDAGLSAVHEEGLKFKVTASAGMPPGLYEVRAAGRYGISASRLMAVGTLPEISDPDTNSGPDKALVIQLPVIINGTAGTETADYFRFTATKGQEVILSCAAERIDSPLNAVLTLFNPEGREIESAHRTNSGDPVINFTAPGDGEFILKLHDVVWQGGTNRVYRLTAALPDTASPGADLPVPLSGAVCDWMSATPTVEFQEPASGADSAHRLELPAVVAAAPGSRDWFEFTGSKDRKVMIDVLSHRLGQPTDWVLQVFRITRDADGNEKSERIAEFDDTAAPPGAEQLLLRSRDPSGSLVCEENTVYRLQLTDRFEAAKPWRLVLRDPEPGFSVIAFSQSPANKGPALLRWSPLLRRGGSSLIQVAVLRRDSFDSPVTLRMEGLPEGVSAGEVTLPGGVSTAAMIVRATPDAKTWSGRIHLKGTSGTTVVEAREAIPRWTVGNTGAERSSLRLSSEGCVLAVTETEVAPLSVSPAEEKIYEMSLGGSIEVPVKFTRDASLKGFKGEWEAVLTGMPGLRNAPVVKPAADATEARLVLDLKAKDGNAFMPGDWTVHASASGIINWQPVEKDPIRELTDTAYSAPIRVHIEPSPVLLTAPGGLAVAPGAKVEVMLSLERRYGFAEAVTLELEDPPGIKGFTAAPLTAPPEMTEAKWVIEAAADTPPGPYVCTVKAKCQWNGEILPWSIPLNLEVKP